MESYRFFIKKQVINCIGSTFRILRPSGLFFIIKTTAMTQLPLLVISFPLTFTVWIVWTLVREFKTQRRIARLRKSLNAGVTPPTEKRIKPAAEMGYIILNYFVAVIVLLLYLGPDARAFAPELPALTAIDAAPILAERSQGESQGFSIMAPIRYSEFQQTEEHKYEKFKGSYYQGLSSLYTDYYYLTIPALGEMVARAEMHSSGEELAKNTAQIETYDFDMMLWGQEGDKTVAAFQKGHHLVIYRYRGEADLKEHMELLAEPVM